MNAKWDSNVGYAWWLMESYWIKLAEHYQDVLTPIVVYPSISTIPSEIEASPIHVHKEDFSKFCFKNLLNQLKFIKKHRVKYLYLTDSPIRHWVYISYRLMGIKKILVHDHTPGLRTRPTGLKLIVKKFLTRIPGYNADLMIGATDFVTKRFIDVACAPPEKCVTVPNGIRLGTTDTPKDIKEHFGIPFDRRVIVTIARANRYKGGFFALDVLKQLKQTYKLSNWHYIYLGDGPDREAFANRARELRIENQCSFPGKVDQASLYLPSCFVMFHPSQGEVGYSLSILEAMHAGIPVLVPDNPSVCGATTHGVNGYRYKENDTADAARLIAIALNYPLKFHSLGDNARTTTQHHFSLQESHKNLLDIFDTTFGNLF